MRTFSTRTLMLTCSASLAVVCLPAPAQAEVLPSATSTAGTSVTSATNPLGTDLRRARLIRRTKSSWARRAKPAPTASPTATATAGPVPTASAAPTASATPTAGSIPTASPAPTGTRRPVAELKIMNYYPSDAAWTAMWSSYSPSRTDADFAAIKGLGANTVRIIVQPSAVGYPVVTPAGAASLADVIATAKSHDLSVQLSLFDWWGNWNDVTGSTAWMTSLLAPYAGDPTIALAELRNELPVHDAAAMAWARTMLPVLRTVLPGVPRTLSGYDAANPMAGMSLVAAFPASLLDVVDVHYYGEAAEATTLLREAKRLAAGRPVIIGETGHSTAAQTAGSDEEQANYLRVMATVASSLGLPAPSPWTLADFTATAIPGRAMIAEEYAFGMRRTNGTWKPASKVVQGMFAGADVADWDGGFERAATSGSNLGTWRAFRTQDGAPTVSGAVTRSGAQAVCFAGTAGGDAGMPSVQQSLPVLRSGQTYSVTAFVRRDAGTGEERVAIAWYGPNNTYLSSSQSAVATAQGTWQPLSLTASAPAGAVVAQVHLKAGRETGRACYDDVTITGL